MNILLLIMKNQPYQIMRKYQEFKIDIMIDIMIDILFSLRPLNFQSFIHSYLMLYFCRKYVIYSFFLPANINIRYS